MSAVDLQRAARGLGLGFALVIVAVNALFVVGNREDWPFTCAPMYSHRVTPEGPRLRFEVQRPDGTPVRVHGQLRNLWVWRSFWKHSWREPATRRARVHAFLGAIAADQSAPPPALDLYLERRAFNDGRDRALERRRVARWTPAGTTLFEDAP